MEDSCLGITSNINIISSINNTVPL